MTIMVTGSAGFIGFHLTQALLLQGHRVIGIDNINDYYDVALKYGRLEVCGIEQDAIGWGKAVRSSIYPEYVFVRLNLENAEALNLLFEKYDVQVCINLAAQAGVRYSITNPEAYIRSNLIGFFNILEACRKFKIGHLVYASSSSVYGLNEAVPFSENQGTNHPVSLYAATKKSNELMAHTYSHLYGIPTTGLRFFTVYGPWGRPDMASYLFADAIVAGKPIQAFNNGLMKRDFTYVDDVVAAILKVVASPATSIPEWVATNPDPATSTAPYKVYNIGNNEPVSLTRFIAHMEEALGRKAIIEYKPMQPGDVVATWADIQRLETNFNVAPTTSIAEGLNKFAEWYLQYNGLNEPTPATEQPALDESLIGADDGNLQTNETVKSEFKAWI